MENKQPLIVAAVLLIGILLGSAGLVYVLLPQPSASPLIPNNNAPEVKPEVHLYKKRGGLTLAWSNLPKGTDYVIIYRAKRGTEDWEKWKTLTIDPSLLAGGTVDITSAGDLTGYAYYAEAVQTGDGNSSSSDSGNGDDVILWQSSSTFVEPPPAPPISNSSSSGNGGNPTSTPPVEPPANTPPAPNATSSSGNGGNPTSTSTATSTVYYYTPDGGISGTSTVTHGNFWVEHVNRNIEVGWQNLAGNTTNVIVYRATGQNGPWQELLHQDEPVSPYSIRLIDNSIYVAHYYRMEATASGEVTSYGPILLPALEN